MLSSVTYNTILIFVSICLLQKNSRHVSDISVLCPLRSSIHETWNSTRNTSYSGATVVVSLQVLRQRLVHAT
jgi:hypothetical protein